MHGFSPFAGETAKAANCAPLEMRLMQLQARNDPDSSELSEAKSLLAQCNGTQPAAAFQSWGGTDRQDQEEPPGQDNRTARQREPSNTLRTLCVRTCDGYYFPVSFSTTKKYLAADEETCQRLCPAGDASIYYYPRRSGPEQMVSIDGFPYADLPNAFRYRKELDRSCTCGTPLPISEPAEVLLAAYSDEPVESAVAGEDEQAIGDDLASLIQTSSVTPLAAGELRRATDPPRVILTTGNEEQDQLLASEVPGKWFKKEPDVVYLRGPGDVACMNRGPMCQPQ